MVDHIIIQAGGKGTRLGQLTRNKPKGIVPVDNLPIIFHLFRQYPDKRFIIIGDYKHEVLDEYLDVFADVKYITVKAGEKGTCAGIKRALEYIPQGNPFMIIWSDLILDPELNIDRVMEEKKANYIGIAKDFECRWSCIDGKLIEQKSTGQGIAGMFIFEDKSVLKDVPVEGELVRWMSENISDDLEELSLLHTREIGTMLAYNKNTEKEYVCRPFNSMEVKGDTIIKRPIDKQGEQLAKREINWYKEVAKYDFDQIPKISEYQPLVMKKINGKNLFKTDLNDADQKTVIRNLVDSLDKLHSFKKVQGDSFSQMNAYYYKTIQRIEKVRDLIPFADDEYITINGRKCRNPYKYKNELRAMVKELLCNDEEFALIHGDCTFSNTMVDDDLNVIFLDPRGYFGYQELYGDPYYDWAKVYYSLAGDYDQFNNKKFVLEVGDSDVKLDIDTNGWKDQADYYLSLIPDCDVRRIKLIHAIIWLSLSTYAWEDYDSICGAFYNGTYLLEELWG